VLCLLCLVLPKYPDDVHQCSYCSTFLLMFVECSSVVLCSCPCRMLCCPLTVRYIVFQYSFCSCGLTLYGECDNSMSACVEHIVMNTVTCRPIARERLGKQARNKYSTNNKVDPFLGTARSTRTQQKNRCCKMCFLCGLAYIHC
jgi:hypothetical protein